MKLVCGLLLLLFGVAAATQELAAQEHPSVTAQPNSISVSGDGKFVAAPDTAIIQFNISAQDDTARGAFDRASRNAEQVRQIFRANGLEPKSAQMGYLAIEPVYDYKGPKRKLVAYRVNANVTLKLKEFTKVAPILQQLSDADITGDQSLNYTLEDVDSAKAKAVEDAYRRARESAAVVARASSRTLGDLINASVDTNDNVRPIRPMMMSANRSQMGATPAPTEEFSAQDITVTAHINAIFALK